MKKRYILMVFYLFLSVIHSISFSQNEKIAPDSMHQIYSNYSLLIGVTKTNDPNEIIFPEFILNVNFPLNNKNLFFTSDLSILPTGNEYSHKFLFSIFIKDKVSKNYSWYFGVGTPFDIPWPIPEIGFNIYIPIKSNIKISSDFRINFLFGPDYAALMYSFNIGVNLKLL